MLERSGRFIYCMGLVLHKKRKINCKILQLSSFIRCQVNRRYMKRRNTMHITIQNPCHETWEDMSGEERKRLCTSCQKHVHNLSEQTKEEAEVLLQRSEGLCVRYQPNARGDVRFRSALPIVALLGSACGYVPPIEPTDPVGTKITKSVRRGIASWAYNRLSLVDQSSPGDGWIEYRVRNVASALVQLSEQVLHDYSSIGHVMGEMVAAPVPVPKWQSPEPQQITMTVPE